MNCYKTDANNKVSEVSDKQKLIMKLDSMSDYFDNQITFSEPTPDYTAHNNQMNSFIDDIDLIKSELLKED